MEAIQPVRGTNDFIYAEAEKLKRLDDALRAKAAAYGFQEICVPVFEHTELFTRGIGEETDIVSKEMFTFEDRGGRSLTLRPEGTASIVRAFVTANLQAERGINKIFYTGTMYRAERPQKGRYREFRQFGVEVIGSSSPLVDAEVILFNLDLFRTLGLSSLTVKVNSVGCPKCMPVYTEALRHAFANGLPSLCETCRDRYGKNILRMLDCKVETCQPILAKAPAMREHLCDECRDHFAQVLGELDKEKVSYTVDQRLVRGLDYYTKTAFEIQDMSLGSQNAVAGGGRYDGLIAKFNGGKELPAIGSALGVERLMLSLGERLSAPATLDVFVVAFKETSGTLLAVLSALRAAGLSATADFNLPSIKSQLKTANKLSARFALILGPEEAANGECMVKNMTSGEEMRVALDKAAERING
ncbi:MAG: histidine--tRNA ligase [Spirochaetota bacterium]